MGKKMAIFCLVVVATVVALELFASKPEPLKPVIAERYRDRIGRIIADDGSGRVTTLYERRE